jgi:hypothetical protein
MQSNPPVLTYDKALFNEYAELMRSRFLTGYVRGADTLLSKASKLVDLLQTDYHLPK